MHIGIFTFLLLLHSAFFCLQAPEKNQPSATDIIYVSIDDGQTWLDISSGLPNDLQPQCVFVDKGEVILGALSGLYHSKIALPVATKWEKEMFMNEAITGLFPGLGGPYARTIKNGFYQEVLGTGVWQPIHNDLNDKYVRCVMETPDGVIFVGCDSGIFKSTNGGSTWKQVLAKVMVTSLVTADGVLIGSGSKGLFRSTDGGEHWDCVLGQDGWAQKTGIIGNRFVTISSGGGTEAEIKADPIGTSSRLRTSVDGGKTWQRMDENHSLGRRIYDIEQAGAFFVCSCDTGIFRSADQGKTWELIRPATTTDMMIFNFAVSGQVIYAVKVFGGC